MVSFLAAFDYICCVVAGYQKAAKRKEVKNNAIFS